MEENNSQTSLSPIEYLATIPGAPSQGQIDEWKQQAPGGRVALLALPPDGKTVFILRGLSGLDMLDIQKRIPANAENPQRDLEHYSIARAVLWTNLTHDGRLDEFNIKSFGAGLPSSLMTKVMELSYFMSPETVEAMSGDL